MLAVAPPPCPWIRLLLEVGDGRAVTRSEEAR